MRHDTWSAFEPNLFSDSLEYRDVFQPLDYSNPRSAKMSTFAFFTDIGGCLSPDFLDAACDMLTKHYNLSPDRVEQAKHELWNQHAYTAGQGKGATDAAMDAQTEKQAWAEFAERAGIDAPPEEIVAITAKYARPLDPNYENLLGLLQNHGIILGVISNNIAFVWRRQKEAMKLDRFFTTKRVILSCNFGLSKRSPGLELFKAAIAAAGVPPQACIFVDDRAHNIECALQAGFGMAILHPRNVDWGAKYVGRILARAGVLPPAEESATDHR